MVHSSELSMAHAQSARERLDRKRQQLERTIGRLHKIEYACEADAQAVAVHHDQLQAFAGLRTLEGALAITHDGATLGVARAAALDQKASGFVRFDENTSGQTKRNLLEGQYTVGYGALYDG